MGTTEDRLATLQASIEAGRDRFDKDGHLHLAYVTGVVVPKLQDALSDVCLAIEQFHELIESEGQNGNFVVHYTSVATIVSILQACATYVRRIPRMEDKCPSGKAKGFRYVCMTQRISMIRMKGTTSLVT